jgi:hypothetical protein
MCACRDVAVSSPGCGNGATLQAPASRKMRWVSNMNCFRPTEFRPLPIWRSVSPSLSRPVRFIIVTYGVLASLAVAKADDRQDCISNRSDQARVVCPAINDQHWPINGQRSRSDTVASNQAAPTPPAALQTRSTPAGSSPAAPVQAASPPIGLDQAAALFQLGKVGDAIMVLDRVIAADPNSAKA